MREAPCPLRRALLQKLEDLQSDRDIGAVVRLVGDEQLRVAGERHRDHGALALPAVESWCGYCARGARSLDPDPAHRGPPLSATTARPRRPV